MMTDQTSHLALDSKLAGIVIPHDGNCHLKDNVYVKATSMVRYMSCTVLTFWIVVPVMDLWASVMNCNCWGGTDVG